MDISSNLIDKKSSNMRNNKSNVQAKADGLEGEEGSVESKLELKKELGVVYGVAVLMGLIIGGGIYISPQSVLRHAQSPGLTLVMWLVGGIFSTIGAFCFTEIGVKFPRSGGFYAYLMEFYSPYIGFMYLWQYQLLIRCGSNALKVTLLANFFLKLFFPFCPIPGLAVKLIASIFAIGICVVNCLSVKLVARSQTLMMVLSLGTLLAIAITGLQHIALGGDEHLREPFKDSANDAGAVVLAMYNTIFAFSGWSALNFIVEEVKNPKRTLPIAIIISMSLTLFLYLLVNLAYLAVLGRTEMLESEAAAISVALKVWPPLAWVFSICIAIASCASFTSGVFVGSRITFAGARNGQVPEIMSYICVDRYTPTISIVLQGLLCLCYVWFMKIDFIIQNLTFSNLLLELLILVAFIRIKLKKVNTLEHADKFHIPVGLHIFYALLSVMLCIVPLVTKPLETGLVCGFILVSTSLLYIIFLKWKPAFLTNNYYLDKFYKWMQIVFASAPGDKDL